MLPGFTALQASQPAVALAGPWDSAQACRPLGTDTFCTALVQWCKDVYFCPGGSAPVSWNGVFVGYGTLDTHTPYPCGVCVGIDGPDDW
ncbi:hypothetical protein F2P44_19235 [Massilia sp. CCM 8695]|uniref:Uncharacterized protein n=1 Tax=Massilia frigida TaxID=2609281 RepID=A0ABX0NF34_9BURK|nr:MULTISPECIES: hypothetical protein [Massilia]MDM5177585.1 hypothetical protein [Massilia sp. DJPM01]NHZ81394.1 hypothetical protein [Massilia frigida]